MTDSLRHMKGFIRKMRVRDGDVILVKEGTEMAKVEIIESFVNALQSLKFRAMVLVVNDFDNLAVLDRSEMAKHGWHRIEDLRKIAALGNASRLPVKFIQKEHKDEPEHSPESS